MAARVRQALGDDVLDVGAVQVGPLNGLEPPVGPVHPACPRIQGDVLRKAQSAGHEVLDGGAVRTGRADADGADAG